jgi:hypothetical protein
MGVVGGEDLSILHSSLPIWWSMKWGCGTNINTGTSGEEHYYSVSHTTYNS